MLRVADNKAGYFGVTHKPSRSKPYAAQVKRGGNKVRLGSFVTAEEAALYVVRSPEGRTAAAERAASATQPRWSEEEGQGNAPATRSRAVLKQEGAVPPMPAGAFVKEEEFPHMPPGVFVCRRRGWGAALGEGRTRRKTREDLSDTTSLVWLVESPGVVCCLFLTYLLLIDQLSVLYDVFHPQTLLR